MRTPTRALIVEDIDSWVYTLSRAARRSGASEVVVCDSLGAVREALREARFDIALLDVGLDPADDQNEDGTAALEMIRAVDGGSTRCILVTGWQGGDRLDLMAMTQQKYGLDWAFSKEKYDSHAMIDKLTELLEQAPARRLSLSTPMGNLSGRVEPFLFEGQLLDALSPGGGVQTLYSLTSRLIGPVIPLVPTNPDAPMRAGSAGSWFGMYWSRALSSALAIVLERANSTTAENENPLEWGDVVPAGAAPELIGVEAVRDLQGRLYELPGIGRDSFAE